MASGPRFEVLGPWSLELDQAEVWRRRIDAGEFATIQELAEAIRLAERHVSRQLRLAYLAPEVLKRLTCRREGGVRQIRTSLSFPETYEPMRNKFGATRREQQPG